MQKGAMAYSRSVKMFRTPPAHPSSDKETNTLAARVSFLALALLVLGSCQKISEQNNNDSHEACLGRAIFGVAAQSPYVLPYPIGSSYSVLQAYCTSGSHENQLAYDFLMDPGSPVVAARAGQVMMVVDQYEESDLSASHFNYVLIRHDDGTVAFYAHLRLGTICVSPDALVRAGQHIADSGHCGTPVADLHFGVYQGYPPNEGSDVAVNFRNADGPLDSRGGLQEGSYYLALPY
jgi:murein DD-endopeptidase MepM/ murein hydrolase activator NlpD